MRKKILYIGLLLLVASIVVLYASSAEAEGMIKNFASSKNITVLNDSFYAMPVQSQNSINAITAIIVMSNSSLNEYVLNASTFSAWSAYMQGNKTASGIHYATMLNKSNSSLIYSNKKVLSIVLPRSKSNANMYLVIDNTYGSNSSKINVPASITVLPMPTNSILPFAGAEIAGIIVLIASFVIIIYGLLRKAKVSQETVLAEAGKGKDSDSAYIENLYKSIEKNKKKSKKAD